MEPVILLSSKEGLIDAFLTHYYVIVGYFPFKVKFKKIKNNYFQSLKSWKFFLRNVRKNSEKLNCSIKTSKGENTWKKRTFLFDYMLKVDPTSKRSCLSFTGIYNNEKN